MDILIRCATHRPADAVPIKKMLEPTQPANS
jgi:hypothetical protein